MKKENPLQTFSQTDARPVALVLCPPGTSGLPSQYLPERHFSPQQKSLFYRLALGAIEETASHLQAGFPELIFYWGIPHVTNANHEMWRSYRALDQGSGTRMERVWQMYARLQRCGYTPVIASTTECPHVAPETLVNAIQLAKSGHFVAGGQRDGSLFLLAGSAEIPFYSWPTTCENQHEECGAVNAVLTQLGSFCALESLTGFAHKADLKMLADDMGFSLRHAHPARRRLLLWVKDSAVLPQPSLPLPTETPFVRNLPEMRQQPPTRWHHPSSP